MNTVNDMDYKIIFLCFFYRRTPVIEILIIIIEILKEIMQLLEFMLCRILCNVTRFISDWMDTKFETNKADNENQNK